MPTIAITTLALRAASALCAAGPETSEPGWESGFGVAGQGGSSGQCSGGLGLLARGEADLRDVSAVGEGGLERGGAMGRGASGGAGNALGSLEGFHYRPRRRVSEPPEAIQSSDKHEDPPGTTLAGCFMFPTRWRFARLRRWPFGAFDSRYLPDFGPSSPATSPSQQEKTSS